MKKFFAVLATLAALIAFSPAANAGYYHEMLNPHESTALTLRTDTDALECKVLVDDVTNNRARFVNCSDFAALSAAAFTGAATFGSTVGITGALTLSSTLTGGSSSNIAINTNKFTVAASSGNTIIAGTLGVTGALTATGGVDGILGGVTPAAATVTALTASTSVDTHGVVFSTGITANPVLQVTYGTCTVAAVNGGTCIPLAATTSRKITVTNFDIVAAGSAATCTGIFLEDTNGTPVVIATLAAAQLGSGAHNAPLTATLGVGFGAGTGLTSAKGVQIIKNGSDCTTTTAFTYAITYTVQ